jgi:hypothetical protein
MMNHSNDREQSSPISGMEPALGGKDAARDHVTGMEPALGGLHGVDPATWRDLLSAQNAFRIAKIIERIPEDHRSRYIARLITILPAGAKDRSIGPDGSRRDAAYSYRARASAALALGRFGDERAVPALLDALEDGAWMVRKAAVDALSEIGAMRAGARVAEMLDDSNAQVRLAADKALVKLSGPHIFPALIRILRDVGSESRSLAARWLGLIGDARAAPELIAHINIDHHQTRIEVIRALGRIGDLRARPALLPLLEDEDVEIVVLAAEALLRLAESPEDLHEPASTLVNVITSTDRGRRARGQSEIRNMDEMFRRVLASLPPDAPEELKGLARQLLEFWGQPDPDRIYWGALAAE